MSVVPAEEKCTESGALPLVMSAAARASGGVFGGVDVITVIARRRRGGRAPSVTGHRRRERPGRFVAVCGVRVVSGASPSPKSHEYDTMAVSSLDPADENCTSIGAYPVVGVAEIVASGV